MDFSGTQLLRRGDSFTWQEGSRTHRFEWLPFERLKNEYFYPEFLKKDIYNLPEVFTLRTEME